MDSDARPITDSPTMFYESAILLEGCVKCINNLSENDIKNISDLITIFYNKFKNITPSNLKYLTETFPAINQWVTIMHKAATTSLSELSKDDLTDTLHSVSRVLLEVCACLSVD